MSTPFVYRWEQSEAVGPIVHFRTKHTAIEGFLAYQPLMPARSRWKVAFRRGVSMPLELCFPSFEEALRHVRKLSIPFTVVRAE